MTAWICSGERVIFGECGKLSSASVARGIWKGKRMYIIHWRCLLTGATGQNNNPMSKQLAQYLAEILDTVRVDFEHWVEEI